MSISTVLRRHQLGKIVNRAFLFGLVKKIYVFCEPIIKNTPIKNKILPKANRARSKKVNIPNKKKRKPPKVKATPNSSEK